MRPRILTAATSLSAALLLLFPLQAQAANETKHCPRCSEIAEDIHAVLQSRCDAPMHLSLIRKQPAYIFLTIYDEISKGVDPDISIKVYQATLDGMECDNINAGLKDARRVASEIAAKAQ